MILGSTPECYVTRLARAGQPQKLRVSFCRMATGREVFVIVFVILVSVQVQEVSEGQRGRGFGVSFGVGILQLCWRILSTPNIGKKRANA